MSISQSREAWSARGRWLAGVVVLLAMLAGCRRENREAPPAEPEPDIVAAPAAEFAAEPLPAREARPEGATLFQPLDAERHRVALTPEEVGSLAGLEFADVDGDWRRDLVFRFPSGAVVFLNGEEAMVFARGDGLSVDPALPRTTSKAVVETPRGATISGEDPDLTDYGWASARGGFAVADFDGDGLDDVFCAGDRPTTHYRRMVLPDGADVRPNRLLWNRGEGEFHDVGWASGLAEGGDVAAVVVDDFDLDGDVDLFLANGNRFSAEEDLGFSNLGRLRFEELGADWGIDHVGASAGAASGDLDGDGDPDLVVVDVDGGVRVYRNGVSRPRRITVRPLGEFGASVRVRAGGTVQERVSVAGGGELAFALGDAEVVETLEIAWPDGRLQRFVDLAPDHRFTVRQEHAGQGAAGTVAEGHEEPVGVSVAGVVFAAPERLIEVGGEGASFLELVDFDNDTDLDLFVGGAAGHADSLWRNGGAGVFERVACEALEEDAACVSADAAFFDADRDGDLDLYVVSGAGEFDWGDKRLLDRIYLGDGSGGFTHAGPDALPDTRDGGECVAASDFDADGDLDLFVGGGASPERSALASFSRFYNNRAEPGGAARFAKVFTEQAPGLGAVGAVRDAVWADLDGDGDRDLVAALEWGPLEVFENRGSGELVDATERLGLAGRRGWWRAVLAGDFDGDGDVDLVVGNRGSNSVYRASPSEPALFYYPEREGRGVAAYFEGGREFPSLRRASAVEAFPDLEAKFETAHDYAGATVQELFGETWLAGSVRLEATGLESGLWINGGPAGFAFTPFPIEGQLGEVRGVIGRDIDGDGDVDLLLDDGLGTVLLNDGRGGFAGERWGRRGIAPGMSNRSLWDIDGDGAVDLVGIDGGDVVWQRGK